MHMCVRWRVCTAAGRISCAGLFTAPSSSCPQLHINRDAPICAHVPVWVCSGGCGRGWSVAGCSGPCVAGSATACGPMSTAGCVACTAATRKHQVARCLVCQLSVSACCRAAKVVYTDASIISMGCVLVDTPAQRQRHASVCMCCECSGRCRLQCREAAASCMPSGSPQGWRCVALVTRCASTGQMHTHPGTVHP